MLTAFPSRPPPSCTGASESGVDEVRRQFVDGVTRLGWNHLCFTSLPEQQSAVSKCLGIFLHGVVPDATRSRRVSVALQGSGNNP